MGGKYNNREHRCSFKKITVECEATTHETGKN